MFGEAVFISKDHFLSLNFWNWHYWPQTSERFRFLLHEAGQAPVPLGLALLPSLVFVNSEPFPFFLLRILFVSFPIKWLLSETSTYQNERHKILFKAKSRLNLHFHKAVEGSGMIQCHERVTEILTPMHLATLLMMLPCGFTFLYILLPMTNTTKWGKRKYVNTFAAHGLEGHAFGLWLCFRNKWITCRMSLPTYLPIQKALPCLTHTESLSDSILCPKTQMLPCHTSNSQNWGRLRHT